MIRPTVLYAGMIVLMLLWALILSFQQTVNEFTTGMTDSSSVLTGGVIAAFLYSVVYGFEYIGQKIHED